MTRLERALLARAGGRARRLTLDAVWEAFRDADPAVATASDQRERLGAGLRELVELGRIAVPRTPRLWEASAAPPLPRWVQLVASTKPETQSPREVAWAPELEFARTMPLERRLEALLAVQRFLASGGRNRPLVPARERSLDVFGDEKAIDRLEGTELFRDGRLSHELLRCFPVSPPMVHAVVDGAPPLALIVENHHTYHSFVRWNEVRRAYRLIGYGAGKAVWRSIDSLVEPARQIGIERLEYFGDLDRAGVAIAKVLAQRCTALGLPAVAFAERWYRLLIERAEAASLTVDAGAALTDADVAAFPSALRASLLALAASARRAPQELVGWEVLAGEP